MALKDVFPGRHLPPSRLPPSRVRKKLEALEAALLLQPPTLSLLTTAKGLDVDVARMLQEVRAALAQFAQVDVLKIQVALQRKKIAKQLPMFLELLGVTNLLLRNLHPRPRRRLTGPEQVVANALSRTTRALRKTLGKRQREKLYPGSRKR